MHHIHDAKDHLHKHVNTHLDWLEQKIDGLHGTQQPSGVHNPQQGGPAKPPLPPGDDPIPDTITSRPPGHPGQESPINQGGQAPTMRELLFGPRPTDHMFPMTPHHDGHDMPTSPVWTPVLQGIGLGGPPQGPPMTSPVICPGSYVAPPVIHARAPLEGSYVAPPMMHGMAAPHQACAWSPPPVSPPSSSRHLRSPSPPPVRPRPIPISPGGPAMVLSRPMSPGPGPAVRPATARNLRTAVQAPPPSRPRTARHPYAASPSPRRPPSPVRFASSKLPPRGKSSGRPGLRLGKSASEAQLLTRAAPPGRSNVLPVGAHLKVEPLRSATERARSASPPRSQSPKHNKSVQANGVRGGTASTPVPNGMYGSVLDATLDMPNWDSTIWAKPSVPQEYGSILDSISINFDPASVELPPKEKITRRWGRKAGQDATSARPLKEQLPSTELTQPVQFLLPSEPQEPKPVEQENPFQKKLVEQENPFEKKLSRSATVGDISQQAQDRERAWSPEVTGGISQQTWSPEVFKAPNVGFLPTWQQRQRAILRVPEPHWRTPPTNWVAPPGQYSNTSNSLKFDAVPFTGSKPNVIHPQTVFDELESICPITEVASRLGDLLVHNEAGNVAPESMRGMPLSLLKRQLTNLLTYVTSGPTESHLMGEGQVLHEQYPPTKMISSKDKPALISAFKEVLLELGTSDEKMQRLLNAVAKGLANNRVVAND